MLGRRIKRVRGGYRLKIPAQERDVIRALPDQLRAVLGEPDAAAATRLFPNAYTRADTEDAQRESEYQRYMREDLVRRRLEALDVVAATIDADVLEEEQLTAWLKVLNDARLVLGTALDVTEDDYEREVPTDDPRAPQFALFMYLGLLLEEAVDALASALPDAPPET